MGKYYVYRHIRHDKDEVFYVGLGTKSKFFTSHTTEYSRAFQKARRNNIWRKIVNKSDYSVEIVMEFDDYQLTKEKEIEFVKLYGRIDKCTGTLANLTDGGDGVKGFNPTAETRKALSIQRKGKYTGKDSPTSISVIDTKTNKIYYSITEAAIERGIHRAYLNLLLSGKRTNNTSLVLFSKYKEGMVLENTPSLHSLEVIDTKTLEIYPSVTSAANSLGISRRYLSFMLEGTCKNKTYFAYRSQYEEGKVNSPESTKIRGRNVKVWDVDTGEIYNSVKECAEKIGIKSQTLRSRLFTGSKYQPNIQYYNKI